MGYTHYIKHPAIEPATFIQLGKDAASVAAIAQAEDLAGAGIAYEYDEPERAPVFDAKTIRFNGVGEEGHETFMLTPEPSGFSFCKTACKPYDVVVVACLCLLAHHTSAEVSSDGNAGEWADGLALARRVVPECKHPLI